jgi:thiol-disulfide isomerase/thioredoxin
MKKMIALLAISSLLVTGCGAKSQAPASLGKVVSCTSIISDSSKTTGTSLQCLDGGAPVLLESIKGPAVINVWGSWCAPCKQEIPYFIELIKTGKVTIIGIDVEEKNMDAGRKFVQSQGISWPNLYDATGVTKSAFGMGVPVTWFINEKSELVKSKVGVLASKKELFDLVNSALGIKV